MILLIILVVSIIILSLYYKYFLAPKRLMKWQAQAFRKQGYKVLEMQYSFFNSSFIKFYNDRSNGNSFDYQRDHAHKYDVVIMNALNYIVVQICSSPQLVQDLVSQEKFNVYLKHKPTIQFGSVFAKEGLVFSEGQVWKKKRKVLNEIFNFQFIKMLAPRIADICDDILGQIQKNSEVGKGEYNFDVKSYGLGVASTTMVKCFFNGKMDKDKIENLYVSEYVSILTSESQNISFGILSLLFGFQIVNYGLTKQHRKFKRKLKLYQQWGRQVIRNRVKNAEEKIQKGELSKSSDLIEALVLDQKKVRNQATVYDQEAIFDEFNTFFIAGSDTTSNYITMMIYLISLHPQVEQKVRKQIEQFLGNDDYTYENLKKCTYIDCVEKEVTRFYGPGFKLFNRTASSDTYLQKVPIKKEILLSYLASGFHFSEKYYENPREFRPERWIEQCNNVPAFAVAGFGAGPRTCIGKHLARLQAKIALIKFMKRYKVIDTHKKSIQEIQLNLALVYNAQPFKSHLKK